MSEGKCEEVFSDTFYQKILDGMSLESSYERWKKFLEPPETKDWTGCEISGVPWQKDYPDPFSDAGRLIISRYWKRKYWLRNYRVRALINGRPYLKTRERFRG